VHLMCPHKPFHYDPLDPVAMAIIQSDTPFHVLADYWPEDGVPVLLQIEIFCLNLEKNAEEQIIVSTFHKKVLDNRISDMNNFKRVLYVGLLRLFVQPESKVLVRGILGEVHSLARKAHCEILGRNSSSRRCANVMKYLDTMNYKVKSIANIESLFEVGSLNPFVSGGNSSAHQPTHLNGEEPRKQSKQLH